MTCEHRTKEQKILDEFLYGRKKCRECRHIVYRKNYEKNREKILEKTKIYREKNPDKVREFKQAYKLKMKKLTLLKSSSKELTGKQLYYVNKLKNVIYAVNEIEQRYNKHFGSTSNGG